MVFELEIRLATTADIEAITTIFNQSIESTTASMHLEPRPVEEQCHWFEARDPRHVVLVGENSSRVIGWAALGPWEQRAGYRDTAEVSVYVDASQHGRGIGNQLLSALIELARDSGFHTLIARIASGTRGSVRLHQKLGFQTIGTMREVGKKFGELVDVHLLQLMLDNRTCQDRPIGYFCGEFVERSTIHLPISDLGVARGIIVTDTLRTFGGKIHLLSEHISRFVNGIDSVGLPLDLQPHEMAKAAERVARHNYRLIPDGSDLSLSMFVTPGAKSWPPEPESQRIPTTICITTSPLPFEKWANKYEKGISLTTAQTREIPRECIPRHIKHRNRLHYYLAEREARSADGQSRALLLDLDGYVAEGSTAAIVMYRSDEGLIAPPSEKVLGSVSWEFTAGLAARRQIPVSRRDIRPDELLTADEVLWCSTPMCLLPVTSIDGKAIGAGIPGSTFKNLIADWSRAVGVDLIAQAEQMGGRNSV